MDAKETLLQAGQQYRVVEDSEFYKYIFKKTEKIVCAVFYIARSDSHVEYNDDVVSDLERSAKTLLEVTLVSLKGQRSRMDVYAKDIQHSIIALESRLRIAYASRVLPEGYLEVFLHELDTVQRALKKYTDDTDRNPLSSDVEQSESPRERRVLTKPRQFDNAREEGRGEKVTIRSRKDRIVDIIKDRGEAMIKDIAGMITDCSEKTIQRELITLIKDGIIVRDGERRWSKYRLS